MFDTELKAETKPNDTLIDQVRYILRTANPQNDTDLATKVWNEFYSNILNGSGKRKFIYLSDMQQLPKQATIARCKRKVLQE